MRRVWLVGMLLISLLNIAATCDIDDYSTILVSGTDHTVDAREPVDYVIIMDQSGSMRGEKIEQAKAAAKGLVQSLLGQDRAAIMGFDSNPLVYHELTSDMEALESAIDRVEPGDFTKYRPALLRAAQLFDENRKVIIFLTDGKPDEVDTDVIRTADEVILQDICLFTIAYAQSADEQAQLLLERLADESQALIGCGGYARAEEDVTQLTTIFSSIYADTSAQEVFTVTTETTVYKKARFEATITSKFNGFEIEQTACFDPITTLELFDEDGEVVYSEISDDLVWDVSLPAGVYTYEIVARETCDGRCLYSGRDTGTLVLEEDALQCETPWHQVGTLLSNTDIVEVQITGKGFNPQSIGTEGVVIWRNLDDKPHKIVGTDGSFSSPVIAPGQTWSHVFPPGEYSYMDTAGSFSGAMQHEDDDEHIPVDLLLVLDVSGSMAGSPMIEATAAAQNLLDILSPQDRAGLIIFSDNAQVASGITRDIDLLRRSLVGLFSEGSTAYIPALKSAQHALKVKRDAGQVVIFLSDGLPHDIGGIDAILRNVRPTLGDSCLYTIGYGDLEVAATTLLSDMAQIIQNENGCGAYYFSRAEKKELSGVFGEIYAATQNPGLELFDVELVPQEGGVYVRTRVRSSQNGVLIPSTTEYGCVPEAEVHVTVGATRIALEYKGNFYQGLIPLAPGEYEGVISARILSDDRPAQASVGSERILFSVKQEIQWEYVILALLVIITIFYILTRILKGRALKRRSIIYHESQNK